MAHHDLVVIGASAGGIEALQEVLSALPTDLDAAVLIVLHTSNHAGSLLPQIIGRASNLPVIHPTDETPIEKGMIYIAPPNHHMIVEGELIRIIQGPRENLHRPAIDPLFRSAAASRGRRVIGVILTGLLDDGTAGLMIVRTRGGVAIVQDPETALFASMPASALEQVSDAHVLPLQEIADKIVGLVQEKIPGQAIVHASRNGRPEKEARIAELDMSEIENDDRPGQPSQFACPDCSGVLWELEDNGFLRYRCRVGHAFTARNLGAEQRQAVETSLWSALRALEESASLYKRMAERASNACHDKAAETYEERAETTTTHARVLREFLVA